MGSELDELPIFLTTVDKVVQWARRSALWPVTFGLAKGSSDLIGYRTVTVTPEMVGQRIAVFTSLEVKTATGRVSAEQRQWLEVVAAAGGIAGVVRSVEDAQALLAAQPDGVPGAGHEQCTQQP